MLQGARAEDTVETGVGERYLMDVAAEVDIGPAQAIDRQGIRRDASASGSNVGDPGTARQAPQRVSHGRVELDRGATARAQGARGKALCAAARSMSVIPETAETTTKGFLPRLALTTPTTFRMLPALPAEVPPNFITII